MANEYDDAGKIVSTSTDEERAKRKAKNKSKKAQMKGWEGDLSVLGNPAIKSKLTATLQQCGKVLNGDWRISSVKHEISNGGYSCTLKIIRPEEIAKTDNTVLSKKKISKKNRSSSHNVPSNNDSIVVNVG